VATLRVEFCDEPAMCNVSEMRVIVFICVGLLALIFALVALLVYGHYYYPGHFQARAPMTNMSAVRTAVGKPVFARTNADGTVRWDYTHWWSGEIKVYFDTNGNYIRTFTDF